MKLLERLTEAYPDVALFHNDLGVLAYQAGDKQKALTHYEHAARLAPHDPTFRKNLADCCWVGFNRAEDALKVYVDILKTNPEDIETLMATGRLCQSLGQSDDARVFFERIMEIEPWNGDAREQLTGTRPHPKSPEAPRRSHAEGCPSTAPGREGRHDGRSRGSRRRPTCRAGGVG